jgi:hypothetical protein
VTADDLGLNTASTRGVIQSLRQGLVSHASLIVNLPVSAEAFDLVRSHRLESQIGLHFNISEGTPLTDAICGIAEFCVDGQFMKRHFLAGLKPLSSQANLAVAAEARAQIALARSHGIPLTHFDSHNNSHLAPNVRRIVAIVARESGILRMRPSRNCGVRQGLARFVLHRSYNRWLARQGLRHVRYLGTIDDMLWLASRGHLAGTCSVEIMTHPVEAPDGTIVDAPSSDLVAERLERLPPHLTSYLRAARAH